MPQLSVLTVGVFQYRNSFADTAIELRTPEFTVAHGIEAGKHAPTVANCQLLLPLL
jgi:hypothetical protein